MDQLILIKNLRSYQLSIQSCLYDRKQGLVPFKPVIYEFIQTSQIALSKRLSHLKIPMATHLVWQTGRLNSILLSCSETITMIILLWHSEETANYCTPGP